MTLSFSTEINGQPTGFVDKIWAGLLQEGIVNAEAPIKEWGECIRRGLVSSNTFYGVQPKLHTIRPDKSDRWKPGNKIHFAINNRTKNRFQFAPVIPCQRVQKINIKYFDCGAFLNEVVEVCVDGELLGRGILNGGIDNNKSLTQLALNDGFDSASEFFKYFNEDFTGKIIHWTEMKY